MKKGSTGASHHNSPKRITRDHFPTHLFCERMLRLIMNHHFQNKIGVFCSVPVPLTQIFECGM